MKPFRLSFDRKSRTSGAGTFFTGILWGGFAGFILPGSREDRFTRLAEILRGVKLDFEILQVAGNRHFLLGPPSSPLPKGRVTILTAHYDRAPGSPGANDNSVSVFLLIKTALELGSGEDKNWRIIFTDREELGEGEGLKDQGAYTLAGELRNRGLGSARIFVFDACGAGNGFIISTAAERLLKKESGSGADKTRNLVLSLRNRAMEIARNLGLETVFLLPTPFSDDAGFLSAGLPAQTITMLPTPEASALAALLRKSPRMAGALINRRIRDTQQGYSIPETWRRLNGPEDTPEHLTPENYKYIIRFALALCGR